MPDFGDRLRRHIWGPAGPHSGHRTLKAMEIGGVQFHMNPDQYDDENSLYKADIQTLNGTGRFIFGVRQPTYTMKGIVGVAGYDQLQVIKRTFVPTPGRTPKLTTWKAPFMFSGIKKVWVDDVRFTINASEPFEYGYTLVLTEFPAKQDSPYTALHDGAPSPTKTPVYVPSPATRGRVRS